MMNTLRGKGSGTVGGGKAVTANGDNLQFDEDKFAKGECDYGPHDCMLLSESALARVWFNDTEEEAWAHLQ